MAIRTEYHPGQFFPSRQVFENGRWVTVVNTAPPTQCPNVDCTNPEARGTILCLFSSIGFSLLGNILVLTSLCDKQIVDPAEFGIGIVFIVLPIVTFLSCFFYSIRSDEDGDHREAISTLKLTLQMAFVVDLMFLLITPTSGGTNTSCLPGE